MNGVLGKSRYFCIFCVFKFCFPEEYEVGVKIPSSLLSPTNLKLSLNASEIAHTTLWSLSPFKTRLTPYNNDGEIKKNVDAVLYIALLDIIFSFLPYFVCEL